MYTTYSCQANKKKTRNRKGHRFTVHRVTF